MANYKSIHTGQFIDEQISAVSQKLPINSKITLVGGVTGSGIFDNSGILNINTAVDGSSHTHLWEDIADGNTCSINTSGTITGSKVYGAVYNDYAEYRSQVENIEPGYCVTPNREGKISKTVKRMQYCDGIVSDTFGFAIGETNECKTPLAVAGRVLAYYNGNIEDYEIGDAVCAGPGGKICKMTREEIKEYPDRIVGTISEFPNYETWGSNNIIINNRIWVKIK